MDFSPLYNFTNYIDAHIMMGQLQNSCIKCWLKDEHTVTIDPLLTNAVGGIKLMVAADDIEDAKKIITDWQTEKRESYTCVKCGSHNIEYVSTPRKISNWLSAIATFFLGNYALAADKVYHCFDCGHESPEAINKTSAEV
jgi:predicted RNA-binding Zn-ribbon protein involved in translation (DUF1610 family)